MDSHADTCILGPGFVQLTDTGQRCNVNPYLNSYQAVNNIPIVSAATFYQLPNGRFIILVINQGLWFGDHPAMEHSLLNPNQLRSHGVDVQDNPFHPSLHMGISTTWGTIPLRSEGTTILFHCQLPTHADLETYPHVHLTSAHPWIPEQVSFPKSPIPEEEDLYIGAAHVTVHEHTSRIDNIFGVATELLKRHSTEEEHPTQDIPARAIFTSKERHSSATPTDISEKWLISKSTATKTLKVTIQFGLRSAITPLARRYRADRMFHYRRLKQRFFTDTIFFKSATINGNTCAQVFANESFFVTVYPMKSKNMAGDALGQFISDYGIPFELVMDGSKEQTQPRSTMMKKIRKYDIRYRVTEPYRHNQNRAEGVIRELKRKWYRAMTRHDAPQFLWDYGIRWCSDIMIRTANSVKALQGRTPLEELTGETPDISEFLDFTFYDYVWVHENAGLDEQTLCRWLGSSHHVGGQMAYYVLKHNGQVISRTSVQRVTNLELETPTIHERCKILDQNISNSISENPTRHNPQEKPSDWRTFDLSDIHEGDAMNQAYISDPLLVDADDAYSPDLTDTYIGMEVSLPRGRNEEPHLARVTKRLRNEQGLPIGNASSNPILDTRLYEVEFTDGVKSSLMANQIADNLFATVDDQGNRQILLEEIADHRSNDQAIRKGNEFFTLNGRQTRKRTTKGWDLLVQWKDGSSNWIALKDMKEAYPAEVATYAKANKIADEPAFAWWVPTALRHKDRIISKVKSKYWMTTHKFGIRIPKTVEEALRLDAENGNHFWRDAIQEEMRNVRVAFAPVPGGETDVQPDTNRSNAT